MDDKGSVSIELSIGAQDFGSVARSCCTTTGVWDRGSLPLAPVRSYPGNVNEHFLLTPTPQNEHFKER